MFFLAYTALLRTAIICVAFLHFGGDGASARCALHKAEKSKRMLPVSISLPRFVRNVLAFIKKFLRD